MGTCPSRFRGVSNLRQLIMVVSSAGLEPTNGCVVEDKQQITIPNAVPSHLTRDIILSSLPWSFMCKTSLPCKIVTTFLLALFHSTSPAYLNLLCFITIILFGGRGRAFSRAAKYKPLSNFLILLSLLPPAQHTVPKHSHCMFLLHVKHQVPDTYKTTNKIISFIQLNVHILNSHNFV
jgi:hypothetical protein